MARNVSMGQGQFVYDDENGNPIIISGDLGNGLTGMRVQDGNGKPVAQLAKQIDGSTALKFYDSHGIGIARFGQFPDGTTALKVAKSGIDVDTATNDQLVFNSGQDMFKIVGTGTLNFTIPYVGNNLINSNVTSTPHGLSYTPAVIAYLTNDDGTYQVALPNILRYLAGVDKNSVNFIAPALFVDIEVTSVNVRSYYLWKDDLSTQGTFKIRYYLLQETAT